MADEDDVRRLALALPGTTERPSYGTPCFRVRDKPFARLHEEPGVLVLWCCDEHEKAALVSERPAAFSSTPHYAGSALVLVRLAELTVPELGEVLTDAWRTRAPAGLVSELDQPGRRPAVAGDRPKSTGTHPRRREPGSMRP